MSYREDNLTSNEKRGGADQEIGPSETTASPPVAPVSMIETFMGT